MKRFIVFFLILIVFVGIYNFSLLRDSISGFFGDTSYRRGDFLNAEKHYTQTLNNHSWDTVLSADILYNLGNSLYRLGEKEKDDARIRFWESSAASYTKSLSIRTDTETEENLAFVKEKLQKEKQEKKKQEEQKKKDHEKKTDPWSGQKWEQPWKKWQENHKDVAQWGTNTEIDQQWGKKPASGSGSEKEETNSGSENTGSKPQPWQGWSNKWSYNPLGWQSKDSIDSQLSDADRQELKKYIEDLKRFERQNGKLLNPERHGGIGSISDQIRDFFGNDSFFQDILPDNDGKKDW